MQTINRTCYLWTYFALSLCPSSKFVAHPLKRFTLYALQNLNVRGNLAMVWPREGRGNANVSLNMTGTLDDMTTAHIYEVGGWLSGKQFHAVGPIPTRFVLYVPSLCLFLTSFLFQPPLLSTFSTPSPGGPSHVFARPLSQARVSVYVHITHRLLKHPNIIILTKHISTYLRTHDGTLPAAPWTPGPKLTPQLKTFPLAGNFQLQLNNLNNLNKFPTSTQ